MKRTRTKLKHPVKIGNLLDDVLTSFRRYDDKELIRTWELWETVVGVEIATHTRPAAFKDRLLLVYASSSVWLHQLRFKKNEIIENLNAALEKDLIDDIRFRIGPVGSSPDSEKNIEQYNDRER
jgi:predicted nucleic acid-binding Zn ribbon protein